MAIIPEQQVQTSTLRGADPTQFLQQAYREQQANVAAFNQMNATIQQEAQKFIQKQEEKKQKEMTYSAILPYIQQMSGGDAKQADALAKQIASNPASSSAILNMVKMNQETEQQSRIRAAQLENLEARTAETRRKTTHPDPDKLTQAQNFANRLGYTGKERDDFIRDQILNKPGVSVTVGGDDTPEIDPALLRKSIDRDQEVLDEKIQPAINSLGTIQTMERLLKNGDVISGKIAKPELFMKAVAQDLGLGEFSDVATTEEYIANAGRQVGQIIKLFGAGTGLSDADREYAQQIAGGNISIPGDALMRIVKASRDTVEREVRAYDDRIRRRYGEGSGLSPFDQAFALNSLSIEDMGSLFQNGGNQNGSTQPQIGGGSTPQTVDERRARLEELRALKAAQGSQ
jgi:hypothetical protein